jgi:hypothetical protein
MYKENRFVLRVGKQCVLMEGSQILADTNEKILVYFSNLDFNPPPHLDEYDIEDLQTLFRRAVLENGCCMIEL